ncbi:hypothetical protein AB0M79_09645 [Polymorphospora sp. NPDC051019]|uniref:hypothetical protein n=1 Tax=Polymorphospora sp. NPDC051019 TaxID=3155725 RepID=UPI0034438485
MPTPLLQVRVIARADDAQAVIADVVNRAHALLGPTAEYRVQTRSARRTGYTRVYLTVTAKES